MGKISWGRGVNSKIETHCLYNNKLKKRVVKMLCTHHYHFSSFVSNTDYPFFYQNFSIADLEKKYLKYKQTVNVIDH